jgi:hypothetical protein
MSERFTHLPGCGFSYCCQELHSICWLLLHHTDRAVQCRRVTLHYCLLLHGAQHALLLPAAVTHAWRTVVLVACAVFITAVVLLFERQLAAQLYPAPCCTSAPAKQVIGLLIYWLC